jgi:hypothetical protein
VRLSASPSVWKATPQNDQAAGKIAAMARSNIDHLAASCGDGRIYIDESPWGTCRFVWLPHLPEHEPIIRYGNEGDYPDDDIHALYEWALTQPWGQASSKRPFDVARQRAVEDPKFARPPRPTK